MSHAYLERREPERNMHRFYAIHIVQTIFGDWAIIREWGRIGSPGTVREQWFDDKEQAINKADSLVKLRIKRGYHIHGISSPQQPTLQLNTQPSGRNS